MKVPIYGNPYVLPLAEVQPFQPQQRQLRRGRFRRRRCRDWCARHEGPRLRHLVRVRGRLDGLVDIETSYLSDGFSEFLDATQSLLGGCKSASAVWGHDDVGGYFLDFVSDPHGGINIAVHETKRGYAASDVETMWSAARGQCRFSTRVPIGDFARTVAAALRRIRVNAVDATGAIEQWFFTFPQAAYERIERLAQRRGYDPDRALRDTR